MEFKVGVSDMLPAAHSVHFKMGLATPLLFRPYLVFCIIKLTSCLSRISPTYSYLFNEFNSLLSFALTMSHHVLNNC